MHSMLCRGRYGYRRHNCMLAPDCHRCTFAQESTGGRLSLSLAARFIQPLAGRAPPLAGLALLWPGDKFGERLAR